MSRTIPQKGYKVFEPAMEQKRRLIGLSRSEPSSLPEPSYLLHPTRNQYAGYLPPARTRN